VRQRRSHCVSQEGGSERPEAQDESRSTEFRQRLIEWQCLPKSARPSLRALARGLNTTHQLLSFYLMGLDRWRFAKDLEQFRANAKARGITVTPKHEQRYLKWLMPRRLLTERSLQTKECFPQSTLSLLF
jgi:hypothetical protein